MIQLDQENADRDLTSLVTVLTHTPDASNPRLCIARVEFGDGTKNLDGSGGAFQLTVEVGGVPLQPSPQSITFAAVARAAVYTFAFPVPANAAVVIKALSPNAADNDVDVTATLYDAAVGGEATGLSSAALLQLAGLQIRVSSPAVGPNAPLLIVRGDDYLDADGLAVTFTLTGVTANLTGAAAQLTLKLASTTVSVDSIAVTESGDDWIIKFDLTAAETAALAVSTNWKYDLQVTLSNGHKWTPLVKRDAHVLEDYST